MTTSLREFDPHANARLSTLNSQAEHMEDIDIDARTALRRVLYRVQACGDDVPWYRRGTNPGALASSFAVQGAIVTLLMLLGTNAKVIRDIEYVTLISPPSIVRPLERKPSHGSSGGGGQHSPLPPLKGELPKPALKVFTPPLATIEHPALTIDPSLVAPPDAWASPTGIIGNPLALIGSGGGSGKYGGIGTGGGPGIGAREGTGFDSDASAGIFSVGNGTTAPSVLFRVDPEYSEEASKAKYSGSVTLAIIVSADGKAESIRVVRSLGMGLDEKAVEAVRQWRFRPGTNKGVPVRVRAQIEVNFRLL